MKSARLKILASISVVLCLVASCKRHTPAGSDQSPPQATAKPAESAARTLPRRAPMPAGPQFAVLAGQGIGPIRIGATVPTIERLMAAPCEIKTERACRYLDRAVEFYLKDGVTERIVVHRWERPAGQDSAGKEREYGMFNGAITPTLSLGMIPRAFLEDLGPPKREERITTPNPFNTALRYYYPGMVLEFDRYTNGKLILGGIILEKPTE